MFTGLIQDLGVLSALERTAHGARIQIDTRLAGELREGDSIAVNGVCLTAAALTGEGFSADVMNETLERSSLGALSDGDRVNLELPLRAGEPLGGHLVQGHVDGLGKVTTAVQDGFARRLAVAPPPALLRYVVPKGSIAIDGVSLTVAELDDASFTVSLIPETLERTNLALRAPGDSVNLEVDVLAKYVEKALEGR